jgi:hypothetical protein
MKRGLFVVVAIAAVAASAAAQATILHSDPTLGFEVRVPKWLAAIPAKPGDTQTIAQFKGAKESNAKDWKGTQELALLIVRIDRRAAPATGDGEKDSASKPQSFTEQQTDFLNGGTTLGEYLERRGYDGALVPYPKLFKAPIKDGEGRAYDVHQISSLRGAKYGADVRAFVTEDENEIFGLIAIGAGLNPFHDEVARVLRSLKRDQARQPADAGPDPYEGSALRDLERRRRVRTELVHGWSAYDTDDFILVTNVSSKKLIDELLVDLAVMRTAFLERFPPAEGATMDAVSTVRVCDGYDDYLRYAGEDMDGTGGYWAFTEEELVLFNPERKIPKARPWLKEVDPRRILYHEAMHQYFHYSNRALSPGTWFNEGYGEVFGGADIDRRKGEIRRIGKNDFRMSFIALDRKKGGGVPQLQSMLPMTRAEFYGPSALRYYAYSWAFCWFLEQERQKGDRQRNEAWATLTERYLQELRKATDARRAKLGDSAPEDWVTAFEDEIQKEAIGEVMKGLDMDALQEAFESFVKRL